VNRHWVYPDVYDCKADRVREIKEAAQARVLALSGTDDIIACLIKQSNLNMRANELNDIRHDRELSDAEVTEAATLRAISVAIKSVRAQSNQFEAEVLELKSAKDVCSWQCPDYRV
jgi:hypothetical protein